MHKLSEVLAAIRSELAEGYKTNQDSFLKRFAQDTGGWENSPHYVPAFVAAAKQIPIDQDVFRQIAYNVLSTTELAKAKKHYEDRAAKLKPWVAALDAVAAATKGLGELPYDLFPGQHNLEAVYGALPGASKIRDARELLNWAFETNDSVARFCDVAATEMAKLDSKKTKK